MPNWCANSVVVKGPTHKVAELVAAIEKYKNDEQGGVCTAVFPEPQEEDLPQGNNIAPGWYIWRVNNWGTKWDFYPIEDPTFCVVDDDTAETEMDFDTAWAPPLGLYQKLEEQGFEVTAYYYEPGMMFAGVYTNGADNYYEYSDSTSETVREDIPVVLVDKFGIDNELADIEADNEEVEDEDY